MIDLRRNPDGTVDLYLDSDTASLLSGLLCQARPRGHALSPGVRVHVEGSAAEPRPEHTAIEQR